MNKFVGSTHTNTIRHESASDAHERHKGACAEHMGALDTHAHAGQEYARPRMAPPGQDAMNYGSSTEE
jgi:hypothetical protein